MYVLGYRRREHRTSLVGHKRPLDNTDNNTLGIKQLLDQEPRHF